MRAGVREGDSAHDHVAGLRAGEEAVAVRIRVGAGAAVIDGRRNAGGQGFEADRRGELLIGVAREQDAVRLSGRTEDTEGQGGDGEIESITDPHGIMKQVEAGGLECRRGEIGLGDDTQDPGALRGIDALVAGRGPDGIRPVVADIQSVTLSPALDVLGQLGVFGDGVVHEVLDAVGLNLGAVPCTGIVVGGELPEPVVIEDDVAGGIGGHRGENRKAQGGPVRGVCQGLRESLVLRGVIYEVRDGSRRDVVTVIVLDVSLFVAHSAASLVNLTFIKLVWNYR